jgi:23S rRNA G2069 N7-methylase RlmK/C1962 C5-methylase RlmI
MSTVFLVNKTKTHLMFKQGYVQIDRGEFKEVSAEEATHQDYLTARDKGYLEITKERPVPKNKPQVDIASIDQNKGMDAKQFAALNAIERKKSQQANIAAVPLEDDDEDEVITPVSTDEVAIEPEAEVAKPTAKKK